MGGGWGWNVEITGNWRQGSVLKYYIRNSPWTRSGCVSAARTSERTHPVKMTTTNGTWIPWWRLVNTTITLQWGEQRYFNYTVMGSRGHSRGASVVCARDSEPRGPIINRVYVICLRLSDIQFQKLLTSGRGVVRTIYPRTRKGGISPAI